MHISTLDILRCPYCGGALELVTSLFHRREGEEIHDGVLGCHCCLFAVVEGIPVMHLTDASTSARTHLEAGRPDLARRAMFNLEDEAQAARFEDVAASTTATYSDVVEALGPTFEGGYFLYRFSDPTYIVADAVVRAAAGTVLKNGGRAIDVCGGSGHLTRSLVDLSSGLSSPGLFSPAPVLADLFFSKVWLARRFTAPGCEGVCCDGNSPLPFARGAFRFAMCVDAFMYIWTKRQFVCEMARVVANRDNREDSVDGTVLIGHTHNARTWTPSLGQPLPQEGYRDLFETLEPRIFGESGLFADVVKGGPLDLGRRDGIEAIDADPALTIIASRDSEVFKAHPVEVPTANRGEYRVNPLYVVEPAGGGRLTLRLRFPSEDYEQEYGACREYLPEEVVVAQAAIEALDTGRVPATLTELVRRRVILDLPKRYY